MSTPRCFAGAAAAEVIATARRSQLEPRRPDTSNNMIKQQGVMQ